MVRKGSSVVPGLLSFPMRLTEYSELHAWVGIMSHTRRSSVRDFFILSGGRCFRRDAVVIEVVSQVLTACFHCSRNNAELPLPWCSLNCGAAAPAARTQARRLHHND